MHSRATGAPSQPVDTDYYLNLHHQLEQDLDQVSQPDSIYPCYPPDMQNNNQNSSTQQQAPMNQNQNQTQNFPGVAPQTARAQLPRGLPPPQMSSFQQQQQPANNILPNVPVQNPPPPAAMNTSHYVSPSLHASLVPPAPNIPTTIPASVHSSNRLGHRVKMNVQPFSNAKDGPSFSDWLEHYEMACNLENVHGDERKAPLEALMVDMARYTYRKVQSLHLLPYDVLIQILKEKFQPAGTQKLSRSELRMCFMETSESIDEFACRFEKLASRGYPNNSYETNEDVISLFLDNLCGVGPGSLYNEVNSQISGDTPATLTEAVETARQVATRIDLMRTRNRQMQLIPGFL